MLPCNRDTCLCCHPRNDLTHRQIQPAVQFSMNHIHRFVNKYEAILNCPVVSIYAKQENNHSNNNDNKNNNNKNKLCIPFYIK